MAQKKDANIGWVVGIIAAAGVIAFVFGLWVSHNISENSSTSNRERAPEAAPKAPAAPVVVPPSDASESKSHDQTQKNLPPAYMIGQQFSIGYWHYICNRAYWTPILVSSPYSMERANADFVVVDLTIRNDDTSASTRPLLHLTDEKGRTYDESTTGMMSSGFFSVLETLNPGVSKRGNIAFDVPPDRQYFLIASGGVESDKAAIVLLPMSSPPGQQPQSQAQ